VSGARVQFGRSEDSPEVETGRDGRYESPLLNHGVIPVCVSHPSFQPAVNIVTVPAPGMTVRTDVSLRPGEKMVVRVHTLEDTPSPTQRSGYASGRGPPHGASVLARRASPP